MLHHAPAGDEAEEVVEGQAVGGGPRACPRQQHGLQGGMQTQVAQLKQLN
jgi:hypothetical protein